MPLLATILCAFFIALLFAVNRDKSARVSIALWVPVLWLMIAGSRNISEWFTEGNTVDRAVRYMEGSVLDRAVLSGLMLVGVLVLALRWRRVALLLKRNLPVVLFFLYCGLSVLWSDYPALGLKRWFRGLGDVVMVLVVLSEADRTAALTALVTRVGFVLLPLSVLFIRYFPEIGRSYGMDGTQYWSGVATQKNSLGLTCLVLGIGALWRLLEALVSQKGKERTRRLLVLTLFIASAAYLIWVVDSMTSLGCLLLIGALLVTITLVPFARYALVLHVTIALIVGGAASVLFLGLGGAVLEAMGRNPSLTGRTEIWASLLPFVENPLLGTGYEGFWLGERLERIQRYLFSINQAHNGYIEIYLNLGWIGVLFLCGIILSAWGRTVRAVRLGEEAAALRLGFFVAAVIYNFTEGAFRMMSPMWFSLLIAAMAIPHRGAKSVQAEEVVPSPCLDDHHAEIRARVAARSRQHALD